MLKNHGASLAVVLGIALAGCGGDEPAPPPPPVGRAEGAYTIVGSDVNALVLENDQIWIFTYGAFTLGGPTIPLSFSHGLGASNNGSFTAPDVRLFFFSPPRTSSLTASYVPGTTLFIEFSPAFLTGTPFHATGVPASRFDYTRPPSVSDVVGSWTISFPSAMPDGTTALMTGSLTILQTGTFSGSSAVFSSGDGCSFNGTLTPRLSGRNVFDLSVNLGAPPCAPPAQTLTGIAFTYLINGGPSRRLMMTAVHPDRNSGVAFFGTR